MPEPNIIVVGASSGGIEAIGEVLARLPQDLPASIFIVQHIAAHSPDFLPELLQRLARLPIRTAVHDAHFEAGMAYVAPSDHHLILEENRIFLSQGPHENRSRPAIDPLFRSAALAHRERVIGVVLSGFLDDGTAGLRAIKQCGGIAVVEDPATAAVPDMPRSALQHVEVDHCLPVTGIGGLLTDLVTRPAGEPAPACDPGAHLRRELAIMLRESGDIDEAVELGELVAASCPECGGPLWEMEDSFPRFRCHTGHAFTARHLIAGLGEAEEQSLWVALRVMEERARMLRRMERSDLEKGHEHSRRNYAKKAEEAEQHIHRIRNLLSMKPPGG